MGVGGKGLESELVDQPEDPVLRRAHPLPADLGHLLAADRHVEGPAADAVPRFEDCHRTACRFQLPRRGKAGIEALLSLAESGVDKDRDLVLDVFRTLRSRAKRQRISNR